LKAQKKEYNLFHKYCVLIAINSKTIVRIENFLIRIIDLFKADITLDPFYDRFYKNNKKIMISYAQKVCPMTEHSIDD